MSIGGVLWLFSICCSVMTGTIAESESKQVRLKWCANINSHTWIVIFYSPTWHLPLFYPYSESQCGSAWINFKRPWLDSNTHTTLFAYMLIILLHNHSGKFKSAFENGPHETLLFMRYKHSNYNSKCWDYGL